MTRRPKNGPAQRTETLEERWLLEAQTARNLEGLAAEFAGDVEGAIALYERNIAEGFHADLPYGRLVALYERRAAWDEAERVLLRAIDVFSTPTPPTTAMGRTPQDRKAMVRVFKNRLAELKKKQVKMTSQKQR